MKNLFDKNGDWHATAYYLKQNHSWESALKRYFLPWIVSQCHSLRSTLLDDEALKLDKAPKTTNPKSGSQSPVPRRKDKASSHIPANDNNTDTDTDDPNASDSDSDSEPSPIVLARVIAHNRSIHDAKKW